MSNMYNNVRKITCSHCGRQIIRYKASDIYKVGGGKIVRLVGDNYCCHECNEYDDNGLLPGELNYNK